MGRVALVLIAVLTTHPAWAAAQDAKAEVLATGQRVFDGMLRRDTTALRPLFHPAAHLVATTEQDGKPVSRVSNLAEFLTQIGGFPGVPLERMWNAEVKISGTIATIWTQYDFHQGLEWSHCGIDSFQMVKGPDGWQVVSLIYTVVRDHCAKNR